jgi:parallel beta-helix repeat protein
MFFGSNRKSRSWRHAAGRGSTNVVRAAPRRFVPRLEWLEDRQLLTTFFTVSNTNDTGAGSLRQAITDADNHPNTAGDEIIFNISGAGVHTIRPNSGLPAITDPVILDATTQVGFSGAPLIELDGTNAGAGIAGLIISGSSTTVRGLIINRFGGDGIIAASSNNLIAGDFIGTDSTGATNLGNGGDGILVSSSNNTVGGTSAGDRNIISGNRGNGIHFAGTRRSIVTIFASNNSVLGNYIGVNAAGTGRLGNSGHGIFVDILATNETIGRGDVASAGNVISANGMAGIRIATGAHTIQGNLIGTSADGMSNLGNATDGLNISSSGNLIGGFLSDAMPFIQNVISGNGQSGVEIFGGVSNNTIQNNKIGTNKNGNAAIANGINGVLIEDSTNNLVGGTASLSPGIGRPGASNIISGNVANGVVIFSSTPGGATGNLVQGNQIGTALDVVSPIPNGADGVVINNAANNLIGGAGGQLNNYISGNSGVGVHIIGAGATGDLIQGNFIGDNQNAASPLPNAREGVLIESPSNVVGGPTIDTLNVISGNGQYGVSLLGASATNNIVENNFIGTDWRGTPAMPEGDAAVGNSLQGVAIIQASKNSILNNTVSGNRFGGMVISDSSQNTVQGNIIGLNTRGFGIIANSGNGILVSSGADNLIGGTTALQRNIISGNTGIGIVIQASGATGNAVQGNYIGVQIQGSAFSATGNSGGGVAIIMDAAGNTIGGTTAGAGNIISNNGGDGITLQNSGGSGVIHNVIQGNRIGTSADGASALGNSGSGVFVIASNNTIGGATPGAGNVISANTNNGVWLSDGDGNLVQDNLIGTDKNGTAGLGNGTAGVRIDGGINNTVWGNVISSNKADGINLLMASGNVLQNNLIGTDSTGMINLGNTKDGVHVMDSSANAIAGNLISGNSQNGVFITGMSTANLVQGNLIGLKANGTDALGNKFNGVQIFEASNNTVGGTGFRSGNVISGNGADGVAIATFSNPPATGNVVQGNLIGTDVSGTKEAGNQGRGVFVEGATNTVIGGTTASARNVISGDTFGVNLTNGATATLVRGNYLGTDITGTNDLGNSFDGVLLDNAPGNTVGGTSAGAGNLISGNDRYGVHFLDTEAHDNVVQGNLIGTQADGHSALGNAVDGVFFEDGSDNNVIGGTDPGTGNTIAFNGRNGVTVGPDAADLSLGDSILSNSIFSNVRLGIDLANDGVTANHTTSPTTGPNNFQNCPVLTSVTFNSSLTTTTIQGTLNSSANSTFTIQFFASPSADPSGFGEGQTFVGSTPVTTDANGNASFTFTAMPAVLIGRRLTATATLMVNSATPLVPRDTSEFSRAVAVGTQDQRFVAQVYRDLLQREVDPTGLANFAAFLDQGGARSAVVSGILASQEYHTLAVRAAFQTFLHRDADPTGLTAFVTFLNNGGTVEQVESTLVGSPEYFQNRGGGTNDGFLSAIYLDALSRSPDPFGRAGFDLQLIQGGTRNQVADIIFSSQEYRGDLVESFYERFLRRTADSSGLNGFVTSLQQGQRDEQVMTSLIASTEYFAKV